MNAPTPTYTPGTIVYASWGYEQTNIDWFTIIKRVGDWITLQPLFALRDHDAHSMTGTTTPGEPDLSQKPIRRRIYRDGTEERGCRFKPSYGWMRAWEGRPMGYSTYG